MKTAAKIARYLAGVIFVVFGLNGFLHFLPFPPPTGIAGDFMGALYISHYLWVIFAFQLIAGVLLLLNRYVPLAVAILAPVLVNILAFHLLMAPSWNNPKNAGRTSMKTTVHSRATNRAIGSGIVLKASLKTDPFDESKGCIQGHFVYLAFISWALA